MKKKIQNKLGTYLAVTAGVGCASSVANAAVVFYGNASNPNIQADPSNINVVFDEVNGMKIGVVKAVNHVSAFGSGNFYNTGIFTRGSDHGGTNLSLLTNAYYVVDGDFRSGGVVGNQNYANFSFDGVQQPYEAVAQFFFDGTGGGYLVAIATTNAIPNPQDLSAVGGSYLSISAGKAMIDAAAAVPEPSSLALLALGATGLLARRRRAA